MRNENSSRENSNNCVSDGLLRLYSICNNTMKKKLVQWNPYLGTYLNENNNNYINKNYLRNA